MYDGADTMTQQIKDNYDRMKAEVAAIVERELDRIEKDHKLSKLLFKKK